MQQTFLHMHRARGTFIEGSDVVPWAFAICRRLLIDDFRRGRRAPLLLDADEDLDHRVSPTDAADDVAHARELASRARVALGRLPETQRAAFDLVRQEGLSLSEAAQALGTTVAAVKLRAHRAYEALRAALADEGDPK